MDNKTIREKMTQGEWQVGELDQRVIYGGNVEDNSLCLMDADHGTIECDEANAHAITSAVNGTYGVGIDPCKVREMYEMLVRLEKYLDTIDGQLHTELKELLTASKLTA